MNNRAFKCNRQLEDKIELSNLWLKQRQIEVHNQMQISNQNFWFLIEKKRIDIDNTIFDHLIMIMNFKLPKQTP
ncbi:hypothetical protein BpHYR1_022682 [Brachionus plicatilis]|uniref:Uncharacterized protein n=1 Tax=Brachionus plicatilis TaxID=10195 RepID=A0A3M7SJF9_BRAPC|nr:hypothetical protein BpHYR1_022682 [Brachionus plicatilis]